MWFSSRICLASFRICFLGVSCMVSLVSYRNCPVPRRACLVSSTRLAVGVLEKNINSAFYLSSSPSCWEKCVTNTSDGTIRADAVRISNIHQQNSYLSEVSIFLRSSVYNNDAPVIVLVKVFVRSISRKYKEFI